MKKGLFVSMVLFGASAVFGDVLVGDLESGTKHNNVGGDWYYFSDAKDKGNSVINNAVLQPDGSYSDLVGVTPGLASNLCAKMDYKLGNKKCVGQINNFNPFLGLGTELVISGKSIDLRKATSISFWARATHKYKTILTFEIVTANITNYDYFRQQLEILGRDEWNKYTISLQKDSTKLYQQHWDWTPTPDSLSTSLSVAQKLNWTISKDYNSDSIGTIFIDNVTVQGIDTLTPNSSTPTRQTVQFIPIRPASETHTYDLLGRLISAQRNNFRSSGVYIRQLPQGQKARTTAQPLRSH